MDFDGARLIVVKQSDLGPIIAELVPGSLYRANFML